MASKSIPFKKPSAQGFFKGLGEGLTAGLAGGIPSGLLMKMTGSPFLGKSIGSTLGSIMVKDESTRKIILVNGWMDAITSLLVLGR